MIGDEPACNQVRAFVRLQHGKQCLLGEQHGVARQRLAVKNDPAPALLRRGIIDDDIVHRMAATRPIITLPCRRCVFCRDTVKAMRYRMRGILLLCALLLAGAAVDARAAGCDGVTAGAAGTERCIKAGDNFRDCPVCPKMVVVAAGRFSMGSEASSDETPIHDVTFDRAFAVGKFEVTFAEWDACVADGACSHVPDDFGFGRQSRPVIDVSWNDVTNTYLPWLSRKAGRTYRLLSEAEWEYVARAGSRTVYAWGDDIGTGRANCDRCGSAWDNRQTAPVGSFAANAFGVHDLHGNVWEWTQDCYQDSYIGASANGAARGRAGCQTRVVRGGGWSDRPRYLRSAIRYGDPPSYRGNYVGFRVARD